MSSLNVVGDWIYYCSGEYKGPGGGRLFKIKTNGTEKTKLSDDILSQINVIGNWIYVATYEENANGIVQEMYKMKTDGTGRTKITNDKLGEMNVVDDWIYYTKY